jgi:hypothetical protein
MPCPFNSGEQETQVITNWTAHLYHFGHCLGVKNQAMKRRVRRPHSRVIFPMRFRPLGLLFFLKDRKRSLTNAAITSQQSKAIRVRSSHRHRQRLEAGTNRGKGQRHVFTLSVSQGREVASLSRMLGRAFAKERKIMKATCSQCRKHSATHRVGSTVMCAECVFATSPQTQRKARIINRKAASKRIMLLRDLPTLRAAVSRIMKNYESGRF